MKYCFHTCHYCICGLWFFKSAKLLGAPRTLGAPGLCPAQLIGCDATGMHLSTLLRSCHLVSESSCRWMSSQRTDCQQTGLSAKRPRSLSDRISSVRRVMSRVTMTTVNLRPLDLVCVPIFLPTTRVLACAYRVIFETVVLCQRKELLQLTVQDPAARHS